MSKDLKKYVAEMVGTAVLVFIACGVAVYSSGNLVATGLAFGLVIVAMAYTIGPISGCHINPAVSLGACLTKKLSFKDFCFYVVAQVIGAIIGGAFLFAIYKLMGGEGMAEGAMAETLYEGIAPSASRAIILGLMMEILLTFIFVFVILGVTSKKENSMMAGLEIGLTLVFIIMAGAMFTGPSVNPARSIGSAVFAGTAALKQVWLFLLAPLIGATLAALAAMFFFKDTEETKAITAKKK